MAHYSTYDTFQNPDFYFLGIIYLSALKQPTNHNHLSALASEFTMTLSNGGKKIQKKL